MSTKILMIEDDPLQQQVLGKMLQAWGYECQVAGTGRAGLDLLSRDADLNLVLLDLMLPDISGMEVLTLIVAHYPNLPVIMLTAADDATRAVAAIKAGAVDFLGKPVAPERIQVAVRNALASSVLRQEVTRLKRRESNTYGFDNLIGHAGGLSAVVRTGQKAAASDIPVLLTGETGTGKEVFARAIHGESQRAGKPFVAVNCGAIPPQLVESTLFGHEKGAFTGAVARSAGRFREAEGGTIFLDEIGELPTEAQVKILRVLQQKEITPVGSDRTLPVNVRVISATNRDLEKEVAAGRFREDLYFRLNVFPVHLPALRERKQDIAALISYFIGRYSITEKRAMKGVTPAALEALRRRPWPGNVRELENTIYRATVMAESDELDVDDFAILRPGMVMPPGATTPVHMFLDTAGQPKTLAEIEREMIAFMLDHYNGNVTQAAQALGLAKSTLYRKISG